MVHGIGIGRPARPGQLASHDYVYARDQTELRSGALVQLMLRGVQRAQWRGLSYYTLSAVHVLKEC